MIERVEAIALRIRPFSETSQVVTWLTAGHGRLVTAMKGAMRPKSPFLGQYDLFYTCELLFYARSGGVHIAKECAPLAMRSGLRSNWRSCACASYACDLVARVSVAGSEHGDLFGHLTEALDFLAGTTPRPALLFWFEIHLLRILGLSPRVDACGRCQAALRDVTGLAFSPRHRGLVCPACAAGAEGGARGVRADTFSILRAMLDTPSARAANRTVMAPDQALAFLKLCDTLMLSLAEVNSPNRAIALETLAPEQPWRP